jgi:FkbM family methyltransferase
MHVSTRLLFLDLLRDLGIDRVCDVGSMDGRDALAFRAQLPRAAITAFEPNPRNLQEMLADRRLEDARIGVVGAAVCDTDGTAPFYLVPPGDDAHTRDRRGKSSLLRREFLEAQTRIEVPTVRLDAVLADEPGDRIALWIDVEGKAYEVIEGMRDVAARVRLIHVEVESEPCIGAGQRLFPDVDRLLGELGFQRIATDQPVHRPQFNALYVRRGAEASALQVRLIRARLRRAFVAALTHVCPGCVQRLLRWRNRRVLS